MIRIANIRLPADYEPSGLLQAVSRKLGIQTESILRADVVHRSVDARKKPQIYLLLTLDVALVSESEEQRVLRRHPDEVRPSPVYASPYLRFAGASPARRPVVVGFGPAGIFAALLLAQAGACPIVLERGRCVEKRMRDVQDYWEKGVGAFSSVSNVQFGEGGAGTFSDGKLNSGIKDPRIQFVFRTFVDHGASPEILVDAKPHIGTDVLSRVVRSLREKIRELGGEVRFEHRVTDFGVEDHRIRSLHVSSPAGEYDLQADAVILAVGHSSRDTFEQMYHLGFSMEQKPFSMGMRIEHLQSEINLAQWGSGWRRYPRLGAADYKLSVHLPGSRSVYSFCMCPGGQVVAAASEENTVVTNGMSLHARNSDNANSALLVGVSPGDYGGDHPLAGMYWQRALEKEAFRLAGADGRALCQTVGDFLAGRKGSAPSKVQPSYRPGVTMGDFRDLYPPFITETIALGIREFGRKIRGFDSPDALLTGPENRSSSPVRILRTQELTAEGIAGIYPCGEGAGYAGGITSAACDGLRCAEALLKTWGIPGNS